MDRQRKDEAGGIPVGHSQDGGAGLPPRPNANPKAWVTHPATPIDWATLFKAGLSDQAGGLQARQLPADDLGPVPSLRGSKDRDLGHPT